jgi:hypothetical protein
MMGFSNSYKTVSLFSFQGGMNQLSNRLELSPQQQQRIENMHWQPQMGWSTEAVGYRRLATVALNGGQPIRRLYVFMDATEQRHLLVHTGNRLLDVDALSLTLIRDLGIVGDSPCSFATVAGLCVVVAQETVPKVYDGLSALQPLLGWPPVLSGSALGNPSISCFYGSRLCVAGMASAPSLLVLSKEEDAEDFAQDLNDAQSGGSLWVGNGDGDKITAIVPLFVPYSNEQQLIIFKERSIYTLRGNNWDNFQLEQLTTHVGATNAQSILQVGGELWFLSAQGISSLSANTALGVLAVGNVSIAMQGSVLELNLYALTAAFAVYDAPRQEAWWFVPTGSSSVPNRVWVQKRLPSGESIWSLRTGLQATCGFGLATGELLTATAQGWVHRQRQGSSYDGQPIAWLWQSAPLALCGSGRHSRFRHVDVFARLLGSQSVTMTLNYNLGQSPSETLTPVPYVSGDALLQAYGGGVYGTASYGTLSSAIVRCFPSGSASYVEITFSGVLSGTLPGTSLPLHQPFALEGLQLSLHEGGTRV